MTPIWRKPNVVEVSKNVSKWNCQIRGEESKLDISPYEMKLPVTGTGCL